MGARRGKPLSGQAGTPENQGPLTPGAQPRSYGSAIYGPEGTYTGYVRSPFGPIRARRPLSEKSQQSVGNIFDLIGRLGS